MKMQLNPFPVLAILLLIVSCSAGGPADQSMAGSSPPFSSATISDEVMGKWARSCALCHVDGEAGAPIVGDTVAWGPRLAQGESVVMQNVLEGFNAMPPLGYCMSCEIEDFRAMINFMARTDQ